MPPKKHISIISVLCVISLGLGYWVGLPKEGSGAVGKNNAGGKGSAGIDGGKEGVVTKEPAFLKEGLVAYYPFNGNAKDENGNDGQPNNVIPTSDRHEKTNAAFGFTGKSLINVEPSDVHKQPNITINFWMLLRDHETDKFEMLMYREKGFQLFMQKRQTLNFGVCSEGPGWVAPLTVSLDQISIAEVRHLLQPQEVISARGGSYFTAQQSASVVGFAHHEKHRHQIPHHWRTSHLNHIPRRGCNESD